MAVHIKNLSTAAEARARGLKFKAILAEPHSQFQTSLGHRAISRFKNQKEMGHRDGSVAKSV